MSEIGEVTDLKALAPEAAEPLSYAAMLALTDVLTAPPLYPGYIL
jgi:hypothetical protein